MNEEYYKCEKYFESCCRSIPMSWRCSKNTMDSRSGCKLLNYTEARKLEMTWKMRAEL
jgi:hypothetical protein